MEFKTLRNIENSFSQIRLYAFVFAVLCVGISGYAVWESYRFAELQRQKVYVLDNGKSLMLALAQDASINR
ncbi:conjugative transposon protein TraK, partial [Flavobacterium sp. XS1P32]